MELINKLKLALSELNIKASVNILHTGTISILAIDSMETQKAFKHLANLVIAKNKDVVIKTARYEADEDLPAEYLMLIELI